MQFLFLFTVDCSGEEQKDFKLLKINESSKIHE